jgi:long-chain fatty acid transport protein
MRTQGRAWARRVFTVAALGILGCFAASQARAQSYGIEFHNKLMPASGGMGGASLARPQDNLSAINGNPATLTQMPGTQVSFGGAWAEPTYNITQLATLPLVGVDPYSAKSHQPGGIAGNIGVTQELSAGGVPMVFGLGLVTGAGAGVSFRQVPESNGTAATYLNLDMIAALGVPLTDRLSFGGAFTIGTGFLDGPFTDVGGMTTAYGMRGTVGATYALSSQTTLGAYWQTKKHFRFEDAAVFNGVAFDASFDHPENLGLGIADESLMDGRLLLAADVLFKQYSNADFLESIYDNQWVYQMGAQYTVNPKFKMRAGYSYNENPMSGPTITELGGVPVPDGVPGLRYIQGQFAAIGQHHLTAGVGLSNLMPGVDMDMLAGGMFDETQQFASTIASVESYWIGTYLTWRFGACDPR